MYIPSVNKAQTKTIKEARKNSDVVVADVLVVVVVVVFTLLRTW